MSRPSRGGVIAVFSDNPHITFMVAALALLLIGFVMVYSAGSIDSIVYSGKLPVGILVKQLLFAAVGVGAAFLVVKRCPFFKWTGPLLYGVWFVVFLGLLATAVPGLGVEANGARRWLNLGVVQLQMSEFAKIVIIMVLADLAVRLRDQDIDLKRMFIEFAILVFLPLVLIFKMQSDLGTTLLIGMAIIAVIWFAELPIAWIGVLAAAAVLLVVVASAFGGDYRSDRWVFMNPWNDGEEGYGAGYQLIRSIYAFAQGGFFGSGVGNSHEKYQYLFGSDTDFIYSIIGEEWGFVGAVLVLFLFLVLLWSGLRIAESASDLRGRTIAGGATVLLVTQAFLNMGCAMSILPTTGKPLPFISSGGSSLISTLVLVGLILSVAFSQSESNVHEQRRADLRIVRAVGSRSSYNPYRR